MTNSSNLKKPINDELYKEVSQELDLPVKVVKDIITNGQSKFTVQTMKAGNFDSIRWPYLGVFKAKVKVANILNYMKGLTAEQRKFFQDQHTLRKRNNRKKYNKE